MTGLLDGYLIRIAVPFLVVLCVEVAIAAQPTPDAVARAAGCLTNECHTQYRDATHVHRPVELGICKICHRSTNVERHEFGLARDGNGLCSFCHWEIEPDGNLHNSLGGGECVICHDPHGTKYPLQLRAEPIANACLDCHAELIETKSILHTPVATGPCTVCHDPHKSGAESESATNAQRCFQCHESTRDGLETLNHIHEPLQSWDCGICHDTHGSDNAANLIQGVPELCFGCHEEIRSTVETAIHPHSVAGATGGCVICHTPHASSVRFGLKSDPLTLCQECHSEDIVTDDGETIYGVAHQMEAKQFLHGPVRQRDCGACHNSHGSDHFRLLYADYSPDFYAEFKLGNYRLCLSCHPERSLMTEMTTTLTDFRNGSLNLHFLHVNKPDKGRTCRACHATHGSNQPKHIADWVQFGQWRMPLLYVKTDTGGSCFFACHGLRAYDRETPVTTMENIPAVGHEPPVPDREGEPSGNKNP